MKKTKVVVMFFMVCLIIASALNVYAFNGTKVEAIASINSALANPEVSTWVEKKFGSVDIFKKAVSMAPEKTVKQIAQTFSDFQQNGGDLETAAEVATWVWVVLAIVSVILTIAVIAIA